MTHAVFYDIGEYDIDDALVCLISSMSVDITGSIRHPHTNCPEVTVDTITVIGGSVTYKVSIQADIISHINDRITIDIPGTLQDPAIYEDNGILVRIYTSGITISPGTYITNFRLRLNNITIHPVRKIIVDNDPGYNSIQIKSGYNVRVSMGTNELTIFGSPGAGIGKYIKGGLDNLYIGLRSVNGVNINNNLNITLSDALISDGGSV